MNKRIKSFLMVHILPSLVYVFLTLLRSTLRIKQVNSEKATDGWKNGDNFIFCFWHGRLLMMPFANLRGKGKVLISRHRDGELIARVMTFFRLGSIRGSFRKGTVSSVREIMNNLREGYDVAITPDGPKGPRYKVKDGIVELARLTGKSIIPMTYSANKKKTFQSWDRFILPYPFSKVLILWGNPIYVDSKARREVLELKKNELEDTLNHLTEQADVLACGK